MNFKFGIMGAGHIAVKFCDAVNLIADCEVAAVSSKSMERAAAFAESNHIRKCYDNYDEMLEKENIDCVYIATTPQSHFTLSKLCMEHKVPILCEKAMFRSSRDAIEIFEYSKIHQVFAMEAMWSRFLPAVVKAKQWLVEGMIGEPNCLTVATGFSFDRERSARIFDPKLGGGAAFDLTVYSYELAEFFMGSDTKEIQIISAWDEYGIDTLNLISMKYEGKIASLLSGCVSMLDEKLVISGTEGKIVIPHCHYANEAEVFDREGNSKKHFIDEETENGFTYEIQEVMNCIRTGRTESTVVPHKLTIGCAKVFDGIYEQRPR